MGMQKDEVILFTTVAKIINLPVTRVIRPLEVVEVTSPSALQV